MKKVSRNITTSLLINSLIMNNSHLNGEYELNSYIINEVIEAVFNINIDKVVSMFRKMDKHLIDAINDGLHYLQYKTGTKYKVKKNMSFYDIIEIYNLKLRDFSIQETKGNKMYIRDDNGKIISDENGNSIFKEIEPKEYVLSVRNKTNIQGFIKNYDKLFNTSYSILYFDELNTLKNIDNILLEINDINLLNIKMIIKNSYVYIKHNDYVLSKSKLIYNDNEFYLKNTTPKNMDCILSNILEMKCSIIIVNDTCKKSLIENEDDTLVFEKIKKKEKRKYKR